MKGAAPTGAASVDLVDVSSVRFDPPVAGSFTLESDARRSGRAGEQVRTAGYLELHILSIEMQSVEDIEEPTPQSARGGCH